MHLFADA
jgi:hypothetical protein